MTTETTSAMKAVPDFYKRNLAGYTHRTWKITEVHLH